MKSGAWGNQKSQRTRHVQQGVPQKSNLPQSLTEGAGSTPITKTAPNDVKQVSGTGERKRGNVPATVDDEYLIPIRRKALHTEKEDKRIFEELMTRIQEDERRDVERKAKKAGKDKE